MKTACKALAEELPSKFSSPSDFVVVPPVWHKIAGTNGDSVALWAKSMSGRVVKINMGDRGLQISILNMASMGIEVVRAQDGAQWVFRLA